MHELRRTHANLSPTKASLSSDAPALNQATSAEKKWEVNTLTMENNNL